MHDQLPKVFCFIDNYKKNYIKRLPKNIAIIYRNYNKNINKTEITKIKTLCKKDRRKTRYYYVYFGWNICHET